MGETIKESVVDILCGSVLSLVLPKLMYSWLGWLESSLNTLLILSKYLFMSLGLPIQVRLQTQSDVQPLQFHGPLDCFRQTFRNEGFLGFFRVSILTL
jgi:hypothetical protein